MPSFASPHAVSPADGLPGAYRRERARDPGLAYDIMSGDPHVWVLLADDAREAGRLRQAETLIQEAYRAFDRAAANQTASFSGFLEEEPEIDPE
jgi:hypothetical protein